jgi:hypothetical protein
VKGDGIRVGYKLWKKIQVAHTAFDFISIFSVLDQ